MVTRGVQGRREMGYKGIYTLPKFQVSKIFLLPVRTLGTDRYNIEQYLKAFT